MNLVIVPTMESRDVFYSGNCFLFAFGSTALFRQQVAPIPVTYCKVISTQHHWCLPTTQHVSGNNTSVENGKRDSLLSLPNTISNTTPKANLCVKFLRAALFLFIYGCLFVSRLTLT